MTQDEINAIQHELAFWKRFVREPRFLNNWASNKPNPEVTPEVLEILARYQSPAVLDLGSGAVSMLHGSVKNLTAADPLGGLYRLVFPYKRFNLTSPVAVRGEELKSHFKNARFDVIHISNALDHTQNPKRVVNNCLDLLKPGGTFIVCGFIDEGIKQNYTGMHQWNIRPTKTGIEVRGKTKQYFELSGEVVVKDVNHKKHKKWIVFNTVKK